MMADMSEKLAAVLRESNLKGAVMMVYKKDGKPGEPPMLGWSLGLNSMSEQAAIANIMIALGEALIDDIRAKNQLKMADGTHNVDGITGSM